MEIKIKNWSQYQSYKDRNPPWVRLHKRILDDYTFQSMTDGARAILPMLWLLACEDKDPTSGKITLNTEEIAFRLRKPPQEIGKLLKELQLSEFITCIETVTDSSHYDYSKTETEAETETERDNLVFAKGSKRACLYSLEFEELWKVYINRDSDGKRNAFRKYQLSLKAGFSHQEIHDGCIAYQATLDDIKYTKALTTLLAGHKFEDFITRANETVSLKTALDRCDHLDKRNKARYFWENGNGEGFTKLTGIRLQQIEGYDGAQPDGGMPVLQPHSEGSQQEQTVYGGKDR